MERIILLGADKVEAAGRQIADAAERMEKAVSAFEEALERQRRFMDDWLQRLDTKIERRSS